MQVWIWRKRRPRTDGTFEKQSVRKVVRVDQCLGHVRQTWTTYQLQVRWNGLEFGSKEIEINKCQKNSKHIKLLAPRVSQNIA